jgi:CheY-like chemotaxis protein
MAENGEYIVRVTVADNGIGVDSQQIATLFDPFKQADSSTARNHGGTGLGLAICKRIIVMMGGEIGVESVPGEGSTFSFTFRAAGTDGFAEGGPHTEISAAGVFAGRRILVAEDVEVNREIVAVLLEPTLVEIDFAENGEEAVEKAGHGYDAVLMDVQMPRMDGYEATRRIRAAGNNTPVIAMTADVFRENIEMCLECGMNEHIGKPFDVDELIAMLEKWFTKGEIHD